MWGFSGFAQVNCIYCDPSVTLDLDRLSGPEYPKLELCD